MSNAYSLSKKKQVEDDVSECIEYYEDFKGYEEIVSGIVDEDDDS